MRGWRYEDTRALTPVHGATVTRLPDGRIRVTLRVRKAIDISVGGCRYGYASTCRRPCAPEDFIATASLNSS